MQTCPTCGLPVLRLRFEGQPVDVDPYIRTFAPILPLDRLDDAPQDGDTAWRSEARVEHSAVCKGRVRHRASPPKEVPHG